MAKKKPARKNKKKSAKKAAPKKKLSLKNKQPARKKAARRKKPLRRPADITNPVTAQSGRGLGPDSGGQSGDIQALSGRELADSESVTGLAEEGQDYEAGIVSGVENVPDADRGPIKTREVSENDVPEEYLDEQ
jgi:hypothetical protein